MMMPRLPLPVPLKAMLPMATGEVNEPAASESCAVMLPLLRPAPDTV